MAAPYLFVGSGLSRRYAGLPDWEGLLRHFSTFTDKPLEYYKGLAYGDLPRTATLLARDFYSVWWTDKRFTTSQMRFSSEVTDPASALKIEVARYFREAMAEFELPLEYQNEFHLLQEANVEGVITTNYDTLMSTAFPRFSVYAGQDELLFSEPQGIAEIYMVHGSCRQPSSLVLTREDYDEFKQRDAYLAAKLMTFFVEHPIIFIGYSLGDSNILEILRSLVEAMRESNAGRLSDRLIYIQWSPMSTPDIRQRSIHFEGGHIEALEVLVPDFEDVFRALGIKQRAFPAHILRQLKSQIYELVKRNDPDGRLVQVSDIESETDQLDVVFGVGAKMTVKGIVGLSRWDLMDDLLGTPDRELPSDQVIREAFATSFAATWYVPYWKHLRLGGFLDDSGSLLPGAAVPAKIHSYMSREASNLAHHGLSATKKFADLLEDWGEDVVLAKPWDVLAETDDAEGLAEYLRDHRSYRNQPYYSTQYAKLSVTLDWLMFGPPHRTLK